MQDPSEYAIWRNANQHQVIKTGKSKTKCEREKRSQFRWKISPIARSSRSGKRKTLELGKRSNKTKINNSFLESIFHFFAHFNRFRLRFSRFPPKKGNTRKKNRSLFFAAVFVFMFRLFDALCEKLHISQVIIHTSHTAPRSIWFMKLSPHTHILI